MLVVTAQVLPTLVKHLAFVEDDTLHRQAARAGAPRHLDLSGQRERVRRLNEVALWDTDPVPDPTPMLVALPAP